MTVGVFFGGMSCEHDISIITGMQVVSALLHKYNIIPIYISHNGEWYTGKRYFDIDNYKDKSKLKGYRVFLKAGDNMLYRKRGKVKAKLDVAIVCCHGLNGEDGTLQGLLQLSKIPYSGSGVLASSVGMDKVTMKKIFEFQGLPLLPYVKIDRNQYEHDEINVLDTIESKLEYPLIIKPSNLGSSIGISVAQDRQQLLQGLIVAFEWDNTIVVEHALVDFDELNCAVLGGAKFETICSEIEQPKGFDDYLTYDNKYIASNKYSTRNIPANISIEVKHKVQSMAKDAFWALDCSGVARCDFLLKDDELYINEINTIPGSLSNYLFKYSGISFEQLLDYIILIALNEQHKRMQLKYSYDSRVLENLELVVKK